MKLNSTGEIAWQKTIGGFDMEELEAIIQTSDGGFLLGGRSSSSISGDKTENSFGDYDYWVVKLGAESCSLPSGLYADNITSTSAEIHWDTIAVDNKFKVYYHPIGDSAWANRKQKRTQES